MNKNFILERKELTATFINIIVVKMLFTYPRFMVINSGNAAWLEMVYVSLISFGLYKLIDFLNKKTEQQNIFMLSEKVGGKAFRILVGSLIIFVLLVNLSVNIRIFSECIRTVLLPNTPTTMVMLFFIVAISVGAYMGIYSICRIHALFVPIAAIVMLGFLVMLIPDINLNNFFPLIGTGTYNVFIKGLRSISIFADVMCIYILAPFCKNKRDTKRSVNYAFLIGGISASLMLLLYCLVYPYPISREFVIPIYQLARIVNVGQYFQRFEAFFEFTWSIAMMLYASFSLFVICYAISETFNTKYYRETILPVVLLAASFGFIPTNFVTLLSDGNEIYNVIYPILFILPAVIGVIYSYKTRERRKNK